MPHIVSLSITDVNKEIIDEFVSHIPLRTLKTARDYLYEDRLVRKMAMSGRILAQLHGYQDSYLCHFELSGQLSQGGCTCQRSQPCSHVAALLLNFSEHSDEFIFPPYNLAQDLHDPWSALFVGSALIRKVPDPSPWWSLPSEMSPGKRFSPPEGDSVLHNPSPLADLHPSWLTAHGAFSEQEPWFDAKTIHRAGADFWIHLWSFNPYLPLEPVFSVLQKDLAAHVPTLMEALWSPSPIPFPQERLWLSRHRLLHLAASVDGSPATWLWNQFPGIDPLYLSRAQLLVEAHDLEGMVRLLEDHWPEDRSEQHTVRMALMGWLPEDRQLPYRIADCLDTGSSESLQDLKTRLPREEWEDLAENFTRRWGAGKPSDAT